MNIKNQANNIKLLLKLLAMSFGLWATNALTTGSRLTSHSSQPFNRKYYILFFHFSHYFHLIRNELLHVEKY
jgi:hypothetical protein